MHRLAASVLVLIAGCAEKKSEPRPTSAAAEREAAAIAAENAAPPRPKPPAKPSKFEAVVDLTFTGAIENKIAGPVGICGATFLDGKLQGGNYGVRTDDFEFQIVALSDEELSTPSVILNVKGPERKSFVGRKDVGTVAIDVAKGATIDAELRNITGGDTVHVKGSVTCGPDYRTR